MVLLICSSMRFLRSSELAIVKTFDGYLLILTYINLMLLD
jgi:hypothetical protein